MRFRIRARIEELCGFLRTSALKLWLVLAIFRARGSGETGFQLQVWLHYLRAWLLVHHPLLGNEEMFQKEEMREGDAKGRRTHWETEQTVLRQGRLFSLLFFLLLLLLSHSVVAGGARH
ncbi:hypothetical protein OPV22_003079 [Ensete ventricosum]|uniref:Uncharacterized protein n=1 Tax=Ensete ventricosum TaxID=4639 RepID=A0AAV8RZU6_ENSVE|nr:hypothetical protein OPV22_003079 [Ensete ventricosum]